MEMSDIAKKAFLSGGLGPDKSLSSLMAAFVCQEQGKQRASQGASEQRGTEGMTMFRSHEEPLPAPI